MIFFDRVSKIYPDDSVAVEEVTFSIEPGEFVSIVGPSGAGKTTLLKLFLAEEKPSDGSVFYNNSDIHNLNKHEIDSFRRNVGMVFQDFRLLPNKTIYENIAFTMEVSGRSDEEIERDVPHVLELVDLLPKVWSFPRALSGGEQQRVAIARALVNEPDVIIADEPTGNLDPVNTYDVVQILKKINSLGTTVILTTHNKGIIDSLGKRVIAMDKGRIVRDDRSGKYFI